jgi:4-hydroxy-4-methyl-2-oxoglutarate aldolase
MSLLDIAGQLAAYSTATIYEACARNGGVAPQIRPAVAGFKMAGPAFPVRTVPGDTSAVIRAIDSAPPGYVLAIDCGAPGAATVWGGTSSLVSARQRLGGCLTNGRVRDLEEVAKIGFPIFAAGVSVRGTTKTHAGWIGSPIEIGDVAIAAGDVIVGDADGVVVVPQAILNAAPSLCAAQLEKELQRELRVHAGESLSAIVGLPLECR